MDRFVIEVWVGSLRAAASNRGLAALATSLAPPELDLRIDDSLARLPFYDADLEADLPLAVAAFRQRVTDAAGVLIVSPEYNFGPPAVIKNALDWVSRPLGQHAISGKVVAAIGSAGGGGGGKNLTYLHEILGLLGNTVVTEPAVAVAKGAAHITADGECDLPDVPDALTARLRAVADALVERP